MDEITTSSPAFAKPPVVRSASTKAHSIVGASRNNGERVENDFYPTPTFAIEDLLKKEKFEGSIYEPACGDGAISKVLKLHYADVYSTDIIDRGYGEGIKDFLFFNDSKFDNVITNPPYNKALEFVLQAKMVANKKIAFLLKLHFLESVGRYDMFQDKVFPLRSVHVFSKRITINKDGRKATGGGMIPYAWYVWDKDYVGKPTIEWIR